MKFFKKNLGFTILELVIVLGLLGTLGVVTGGFISNSLKNNNKLADKVDVQTSVSALMNRLEITLKTADIPAVQIENDDEFIINQLVDGKTVSVKFSHKDDKVIVSKKESNESSYKKEITYEFIESINIVKLGDNGANIQIVGQGNQYELAAAHYSRNTLNSQFGEDSEAVVYFKNDGIDEEEYARQEVIIGTSPLIFVTTPVRDSGYRFMGWSFDNNANVGEYKNGSPIDFVIPDDDKEEYDLYAIWREVDPSIEEPEKHFVTVKYEAENWENIPENEDVEFEGDSYEHNISSNVLRKDGYAFNGWKYNNSTIAPGGLITLNAGQREVTLKIDATENDNGTVGLVYDKEGWDGLPKDPDPVRCKGTITSYEFTIGSERPTSDDKTFLYWTTQPNGQGTIYYPGKPISVNAPGKDKTETVTLYAYGTLKSEEALPAKLTYSAPEGEDGWTNIPGEQIDTCDNGETEVIFDISELIPKKKLRKFVTWVDEKGNTYSPSTTTDKNTISVAPGETVKLTIGWESKTIYEAVDTKDMEIGDYVTYYPTMTEVTVGAELTGYDKDQTYNPSETQVWQVFSKNDETKTVELISSKSVGDLTLRGKTGYIGAVQTLQDISKAYINSTYAVSARHLGYSEIGLTSEEIKNYNKIDTSKYPVQWGKSQNNIPYVDEQYASDVNVLKAYDRFARIISVWLASRGNTCTSFDDSTLEYYGVKCYYNRNSLWSNSLYGHYKESYSLVEIQENYGVHPIVTLRPEVKVASGNGYADDSFTIQKIQKNDNPSILMGPPVKKVYTITFDPNGGTGGVQTLSAQTDSEGQNARVKISSKPVREGRTLLGWSTDKIAETVRYKNETVYYISSDVTLYAVWGGLEEGDSLTKASIGEYVKYESGHKDEHNDYSMWRVFNITDNGVELVMDKPMQKYTERGWRENRDRGALLWMLGRQISDKANGYSYAAWQWAKSMEIFMTDASRCLNTTYAKSVRPLGCDITKSEREEYKNLGVGPNNFSGSYNVDSKYRENAKNVLKYNLSGYPYETQINEEDCKIIWEYGDEFFSGWPNTSNTGASFVWIGSRHVDTYDGKTYFRVSYTMGKQIGQLGVYAVDSNNNRSRYGYTGWVCPIVTLKDGIKVTGGSGTSGDPYIIGF